MDTFNDTSCAIAALFARLLASSDILMGSLFNLSEAQFLKLCDDVAKDFKRRENVVERISDSLRLYGMSCFDVYGTETLKYAQDKLEKCILNLNECTGELAIAEGKLKGLKYFQEFLKEHPDLSAETLNHRIKHLMKSSNEIQSRKDSDPINISGSTRILERRIDCCYEEIARLQKMSENVSKTRAEKIKASETEIKTVEGEIKKANTSLQHAKKEYNNADRELEEIRASLGTTNLETLRQVEAIGKAVTSLVHPMQHALYDLLHSVDVVQRSANSLNQYHFMLVMSKLAVSAAAYHGDGLLLDYFLPDSYLHRTQERVNSIIKRDAIGPIYQPTLPGGGKSDDEMDDWY